MPTAGRPPWPGQQGRILTRNLKARHLPCWLCGQPIDYTLHHTDPMAFTVDHRKPRHTHPHLTHDPANLAPAHRACNRAKSSGTHDTALGTTSAAW